MPSRRVWKPSTAPDCWMSSALPAAALAARVDEQHARHALAARERVRDGAAELAGADDADGRHDSVEYSSGAGSSVARAALAAHDAAPATDRHGAIELTDRQSRVRHRRLARHRAGDRARAAQTGCVGGRSPAPTKRSLRCGRRRAAELRVEQPRAAAARRRARLRRRSKPRVAKTVVAVRRPRHPGQQRRRRRLRSRSPR